MILLKIMKIIYNKWFCHLVSLLLTPSTITSKDSPSTELYKEFFFYWTKIINNFGKKELLACHEVVMNVISIKEKFFYGKFFSFLLSINAILQFSIMSHWSIDFLHFTNNFFVKYFLPCVQIIVCVSIHFFHFLYIFCTLLIIMLYYARLRYI